MAFWRRFSRRSLGGLAIAGVVAHLLVAGLLWETYGKRVADFGDHISSRDATGMYLGKLPAPTQPGMLDQVGQMLTPEPEYQFMTIRHIPPVQPGTPMPHPYVGPCNNCHLFVGGPPPGTQPKTPIGAVLEEMSKVRKVGPPILPTSHQPHPPAGRCIKCHDIVIKAPVDRKPGDRSWTL